MTIWIDAQLSPSMAEWIRECFGVEAHAVRELALRDATDQQIFAAARERGAIVMTKDSDFIGLVNQLGAPPQVIWLTCGNTSNARLRQILSATLGRALDLLASGEPIVEIKDGL
jgi:predicted nuclease of predicted toxin-antitoxin system